MSSRFVNSSSKSGGQKQPIQRVLSQQPPLTDTRRSPAFNYAATGGSTMSRSVNYYSTKRYRKLDEIFDRQLSLNTSSTLTNYWERSNAIRIISIFDSVFLFLILMKWKSSNLMCFFFYKLYNNLLFCSIWSVRILEFQYSLLIF